MFRLLVVDDEKNERDCLLYLIQNAQLPFEVREAENGADALRILEEWTADVILSDVQMPVMGGLEFLREACALYPETRVIIFSNYAEFEYAKAAMHLGVENYILKPSMLNLHWDIIHSKALKWTFLKTFFCMNYLIRHMLAKSVLTILKSLLSQNKSRRKPLNLFVINLLNKKNFLVFIPGWLRKIL